VIKQGINDVNLTRLNTLEQRQFTAVLADIFEHSAWVAQQVWAKRPFVDVDELHRVMVAQVSAAGLDPQLALLRAHPELAGKEAQGGGLTSASESEQAGANLDSLNSAEMVSIERLNRAYRENFGFPFIIAVRNHTKDGIFAEFERRVENDIVTERSTALEQVAFIARFRLDDLLLQ
jgi:OHCU decarboxylase